MTAINSIKRQSCCRFFYVRSKLLQAALLYYLVPGTYLALPGKYNTTYEVR